MKRRLFHATPEKRLTVECLRPESPHIHYHCRGSCPHPAQFTVLRDGKKVENLCRHHAASLCEQNGLHLPELHMTIPAFGRCTPVQVAMLFLAGYDLEEFDPSFIHDEELRLETMRRGRRQLVQITGWDYGFDLDRWRKSLMKPEQDHGYTHPYAFKGVDKAIQSVMNDAEFCRLAKLAESSG